MNVRDTLERLAWTVIAAYLGASSAGVLLTDIDARTAAGVAAFTAGVNFVLLVARARLAVLPDPGAGLPLLPVKKPLPVAVWPGPTAGTSTASQGATTTVRVVSDGQPPRKSPAAKKAASSRKKAPVKKAAKKNDAGQVSLGFLFLIVAVMLFVLAAAVAFGWFGIKADVAAAVGWASLAGASFTLGHLV